MEDLVLLCNILQALILAGGGARCVYCAIRISMGTEEEESYKKRARNVVIFVVLALGITQFLKIVQSYY